MGITKNVLLHFVFPLFGGLSLGGAIFGNFNLNAKILLGTLGVIFLMLFGYLLMEGRD